MTMLRWIGFGALSLLCCAGAAWLWQNNAGTVTINVIRGGWNGAVNGFNQPTGAKTEAATNANADATKVEAKENVTKAELASFKESLTKAIEDTVSTKLAEFSKKASEQTPKK